MTSKATDRCRLCGGSASHAFKAIVLGRHEVSYYVCGECGSLETETPYWLDEAYESAIAATDTGAVLRTLMSHAAVAVTASVLRIEGRLLDFGGGTGMLCRLLRDRGLDAHVYDRYADPVYAKAYVLDLPPPPECEIGLISAIEVFEHWADPAAEVARLFAMRPRALIATTLPYCGQGPDWWYLGTHSGQHIFFYSKRALQYLARKFHYHYFSAGSFHIFSANPLTVLRRAALKALLSGPGIRLARTYFAATHRGTCADRDYADLCRKLPSVPDAAKASSRVKRS